MPVYRVTAEWLVYGESQCEAEDLIEDAVSRQVPGADHEWTESHFDSRTDDEIAADEPDID